MRFRLPAVVLALCLAVSAQQSLTIEELVSFIKSSQQLKQTDREIASFLSKVKMKERLDDRTIETLEGMGIGAKTRQALDSLKAQSQSLAAAPAVNPEPKAKPRAIPNSEEQAAIISDAREYALGYSKNLPNFLCMQVVRRKMAPPLRRGDNEPSWRTMDTLTLRLSYYEQKEDYKLVLVNDRYTTQDYATLGGATSRGEFGSMLKDIFEPRTEARFEWDRWTMLRGQIAMRFHYQVDQARSNWHITYEREKDLVPAYSGYVVVDPATHVILRVTLDAENIPEDFPVKDVHTILDYDYTDISGHQFLLPIKTQTTSRADGLLAENDSEFRNYNKYSAEAEIKYDTIPDPIPEEKTKETPVPPAPPKKK